VAEAEGQNTIEFRLELLKKAKEIPVGGNNDYDADRSVGMLDLVKSELGSGAEWHFNRGVGIFLPQQLYSTGSGSED